MRKFKKIIWLSISLELLFGVLVGVLYINSLGPPTQTLMDSIFSFYLTLNIIFFGVTLFIGVLTTVYLREKVNLASSIFYSLVLGIGFLIIHASIIPLPLMAFLSLTGFILGFNYPILKKLNVLNGS